jgi:ribosomal-protein-alanine N-acetyltransferase
MGPVIIRDATRSDFPLLLTIDQTCFSADIAYDADELAYYMERSQSHTLVAEVGQQVVGFLLVDIQTLPTGLLATLITLDVVEIARRTGIGSALFARSEAILVESGVSRYQLQVDTTNKSAIEFYRRAGFDWIETLEDYYPNSANAYVMEKTVL